MLELIFRGFLEWIYALIVEIWGFIAGGLLDIMILDFAYLQTHVPIMDQMAQIILAAGWALLLGNLVFQALKSMAAGLGFEGEDPKLLFTRTFVFAFLLLASPQICRIGLDLTSNIMDLLKVPDATDVELVNEGIFGSLTSAWLMAMICSVIVMFKVLKLVIEVAERYVILAMLTLCAPLAFAMGGSKNTASIFSGWCRMFGSMCLLMVTNLVCCKMLFSVVSTVPSGLDVLPWMVLIFAIVKVAHKSDAIITRIGLNPAITGGGGRTLPGMLAYTVIRTAASQVVKGVGGGGSATKTASSGSAGSTRFNGTRFSGTSYGGQNTSHQSANSQSSSSQGSAQQNSAHQSTASQNGTQQANTQQENTSRSASQQTTNTGTTSSNSSRTSQTGPRGPQGQQTRRSSVPPGTRRAPSHVPPTSNTTNTQGAPNSQTAAGQKSSASATMFTSWFGPAGTAPKTMPPKQTSGTQPNVAGTSTRSTVSTHSGAGRPGPAGTAAAGKGGTVGASTPRPGPAGTPTASTRTTGSRTGPAGSPSRTMPPKQPGAAQPGPAGTVGGSQPAHSTHSNTQVVSGGTVNSTSLTSEQTNVTVGRGTSTAKAPSATAPRPPHPGGSATSASTPKPGKTRSTRREKPAAATKAPEAPTPGAAQSGAARKPSRSTQRPVDSLLRPGRNAPAPPAAAASPSNSTSPSPAQQQRTPGPGRTASNSTTTSSTVTQERVSGTNHTTAKGTAPSPVRQEQRKPPAPAPSVKGGAPTVRPGPAGTALTGQQTASTKRPTAHSSKRAKPTRRPPPRNRGGNGNG